ncbi:MULTISPECIES: histidine kinase [Bacillaceae]|uniref:sensor histidine kinase n=1 Tax=Bacillaceae TaxID=186817 RepID=UPI0006F3D9F0|nr:MULTISPECIES: histidine kinase [Bacillaceae]KQL32594.1 histidine kinase [Psychrobacillus sp. FJAT-21963]MDF2067901.1 histidine kinase [Bacillus sp. Cr_A10]
MTTIQKKIWMLVSVVLLIMGVIWLTLTYYNQKTQEQSNEILQRYLRMNEVTTASQQLITNLNNYLLNPTDNHKKQVEKSIRVIEEVQQDVAQLRTADNEFSVTNYIHLIDSLIETTNRSIMFSEDKEMEGSTNEFNEANRISAYISEMTLTILDRELKTYNLVYRDIISQSEELEKLGIWLLLLITVVLLLATYWFSLTITKPIHQLTKAANELSEGRFNQQIQVKSNDEIAFLAKTFDKMRININDLIVEIQQKAQLEHELQQSKLLLKESQLKSLQSQINPHFLFNTLNTLSKKAYLDGAEETSDLLVSVAGLLRYNLKRIDRSVTLFEEMIVLNQYMEIQKARFTDRLKFESYIDESCLHVKIPGLTLQPIIENAVIHAIEPEEDGGTIFFRIKKKEDNAWVIIEIEDSGKGMSQEKMERLLKGRVVPGEGHSTGIGFQNVVKRLDLFYGMENLVTIDSKEGRGTKVIIQIPNSLEEQYHDEASYC